jgi:hypothetical protein
MGIMLPPALFAVAARASCGDAPRQQCGWEKAGQRVAWAATAEAALTGPENPGAQLAAAEQRLEAEESSEKAGEGGACTAGRPQRGHTCSPTRSVAATYDCTCGTGGRPYAPPQLTVGPTSLTTLDSLLVKGSVQCILPARYAGMKGPRTEELSQT